MVNAETRVIVGPDGTVLGASGELASGMTDLLLAACESVPPEVRNAVPSLLLELRQSPDRLVTRDILLHGGQQRVQLTALEAIIVRRTPVDLRALLTAKLAVLESQAAATGVTLTVSVAADVPVAVALDAEKIAWSVTTLVGNALRYVQAGSRRKIGGTITVGASHDSAAGMISVEVRDDGPGIPSDTVARLFRRDGLNVQGSGLALLLMRDICAAHGGKVDVHSSIAADDHGTTARLTFAVG